MANRKDLRTDADWERFARANAYWAVLTEERFRRQDIDAGTRAAFFATGEEHIEWLNAALRVYLHPGFTPRRALDFGCGVGRLLLPLARRCEEVVGVDVSDTMLREAKANCREAGAGNVKLVRGDDELSAVAGSFDLVHTLIVLQHIPVERGERIFRRLVELVAPGGCGVLHVTYATTEVPDRSLRARARAVWHAIRQRPRKMQMNLYSLNALFQIVQEAGARQIHTTLSNHDGVYGVLFLFRKEPVAAA